MPPTEPEPDVREQIARELTSRKFRKVLCHHCGGTGAVTKQQVRVLCERCSGEGYYWTRRQGEGMT